MLTRKRRRTTRLTLALIGAATLAACSSGTDRRDMYANKQDCVQDWGDETKCEPVTRSSSSSSSSHSSSYYYGPRYSGGSYRSSTDTHPDGASTGPRPGSRAISTAHVSRGGFGSSSRGHSSGG